MEKYPYKYKDNHIFDIFEQVFDNKPKFTIYSAGNKYE
jgi:hypothetical protein